MIYGIVFMLIPGKYGVNFYMCTGDHPSKDFYNYKKVLQSTMFALWKLILTLLAPKMVGYLAFCQFFSKLSSMSSFQETFYFDCEASKF